jgi:hypothetical protein
VPTMSARTGANLRRTRPLGLAQQVARAQHPGIRAVGEFGRLFTKNMLPPKEFGPRINRAESAR